MQIVTKELSTALSTMTVKNCEKLDLELRLLVAVWFNAWLFEIKNDRDPIFVVVSHETIMSVGPVSNHVG